MFASAQGVPDKSRIHKLGHPPDLAVAQLMTAKGDDTIALAETFSWRDLPQSGLYAPA